MTEYRFDFALCFAGEDRTVAEQVATILKTHGTRVFYDRDYQADLLGKDLAEYFSQLFQEQALYCILFISSAYLNKPWCRWERRSALARAFASRKEYIIPYYLEDVDLPSVPRTIGRANLSETPPNEFAVLLLKKLYSEQSSVEVFNGFYLSSPREHEGHLYATTHMRSEHWGPDIIFSVYSRALLNNLQSTDMALEGRVIYEGQKIGNLFVPDSPFFAQEEVSVPPHSSRVVVVPLAGLIYEVATKEKKLSVIGPPEIETTFIKNPDLFKNPENWVGYVSKDEFSVLDGSLYKLDISKSSTAIQLRVLSGKIRFSKGS